MCLNFTDLTAFVLTLTIQIKLSASCLIISKIKPLVGHRFYKGIVNSIVRFIAPKTLPPFSLAFSLLLGGDLTFEKLLKQENKAIH